MGDLHFAGHVSKDPWKDSLNLDRMDIWDGHHALHAISILPPLRVRVQGGRDACRRGHETSMRPSTDHRHACCLEELAYEVGVDLRTSVAQKQVWLHLGQRRVPKSYAGCKHLWEQSVDLAFRAKIAKHLRQRQENRVRDRGGRAAAVGQSEHIEADLQMLRKPLELTEGKVACEWAPFHAGDVGVSQPEESDGGLVPTKAFA